MVGRNRHTHTQKMQRKQIIEQKLRNERNQGSRNLIRSHDLKMAKPAA